MNSKSSTLAVLKLHDDGSNWADLLNFEIVLSIGSSAGYGRISQQQEILYGFCLFCYSLVCKALILCWPNMNLFINILLALIYFLTQTSLPRQRDNLAVARQLFSHFVFIVRNHQSCKLRPGSVGQAAQGTSGQRGREKEWKSSLEVTSLVQSLLNELHSA
jgi:hypothetical protein